MIQSDHTPIKVAYRFRTKGLQWLWIHTKFQLVNTNQNLNSKTFSVRGFNEVIGINEILSNKEILESSSSKKTHSTTSMVTNDLTEKDFVARTTSTNALNDTNNISFNNDVSYNLPLAKSNSSSSISIKLDKSSDLRKDSNRQVTFFDNSPSIHNMASSEKSEASSENKLDQSLEVNNYLSNRKIFKDFKFILILLYDL